jgi:Uma2 family endonuclease
MATAVATQAKPAAARPSAYQPYRFTVKQYHRMIETRVLTADDRVELLEGWVIEKMPHNPRHDGTVGRINRRLLRLLPEDWLLRIQCAITLRGSEPEPDLAIVRGPEETYFERHPCPQDIALLIEVADSSLLDDRRGKGVVYARARIGVYWIVNIKDSRVEVYTQPVTGKSPRYREQEDFGRDQSIPLILGGKELARLPGQELLPPSAKK